MQYPSGTNLANVNVTARNETTNESQTLTSNSSGEVIFNMGDTQYLPDGFLRGDRVTVYTLYMGYANQFTFTIPNAGESTPVYDTSNVSVGTATGAGLTGTLVLVAVSTSAALRYYTVNDFLTFFDLKEYNSDAENGVKPQQIVLIGTAAEESIDDETRTKFDSNSGAYYTVTQEHHDCRYSRQSDYFTKKVPITEVSTVQIDSASDESEANWITLTADTEYNVDLETGRIHIKNSARIPEVGKRHFRATYKYGRSSVPAKIRILAMQDTAVRMMAAGFLKARMADQGSFELQNVSTPWFVEYRRSIINEYKNPIALPT